MKRFLAHCFAIVCGSMASASFGQSTQPVEPPANSRERYAILVDKNIFVRNRPAARSNRQPPSGGVRRPEEMMVLTGVALQEGRNVAFIENRTANSTQRLVAGSEMLGGKVVDVGFDSLEFESNGRRTQVRIGRNFLGDVSAAPVTPTATTPTSGARSATAPTNAAALPAPAPAAAVPAPPPLPNDANLSIEEKMKLRAQQLRN